MKAEGKRFLYNNSDIFVVPKPLGKPLIASKLPQFS